mmetsp:Transcript_795/g.1116  ORF Transcript_795/g.1116 Transcript_795/m.1116 type:complete len:300 (+) Transcript_795:78-977(+)
MDSYFSSTSTDAAGTIVEVTFPGTEEPPRFGLGYWSIRGLGAPLTMMLCAAKQPFTLFLYDLVENDSPAWTSDYFAAKAKYIEEYNQPLWNLPFCADREEKRVVCQTNAIISHVGRIYGFMGEDSVSTSQCEELLNELYDLRNIMTKFAYGGPEDTVEKDGGIAKETLAGGMKHLAKLEVLLKIQSNKEGASAAHLVNGKMSAPDFHLFELLDQFEGLCQYYNLGDLYENLPQLKGFKSAFGGLSENQFYLDSWLHKELPYNNTLARFGSLPGPKTYSHTNSASLATWRNKGLVKLSPP